MTIQSIRLFGDPVLRTPAAEVTDFDHQIRQLVTDLQETMLAAPGAGLAAPQIGVGLRVFTFHISAEEQGHLINPQLHFPDDEEQYGPEGCLSIPGLTLDCRRKANVVARGFNMFGEPIAVEGTAKLARAIQHETDHLDGVLFLDRLDAQTRKDAMRAIRNADWFDGTLPTIKASPHATPPGSVTFGPR